MHQRTLTLTSTQQLSPLTDRFFDPVLDPLGILRSHHRANLIRFIELISRADLVDFRGQFFQKFVVDLIHDNQTLRADANLPRVGVARLNGGLNNPVQIGVGQHHQRTVGAELHRYFLQSRNGTNSLADFLAAGEADFSYPSILAERLPDVAATSSQDAYPQRRKTTFQQDLDQFDRNEGRIAGGF